LQRLFYGKVPVNDQWRDQQMAMDAALEVVVNSFFLAQALNEVQIGFVVLHAVLAFGVDRAELELVGVGLNAMLL
jgi:hypothetical protein